MLSRLRLGRRPHVDELAVLSAEVVRLRSLTETSAQTASAALVRAARAEDRAVAAEQRARSAESRLGQVFDELAGLRSELAGLREELVWAFAEGRMPVAPKVIDLRDESSRTA